MRRRDALAAAVVGLVVLSTAAASAETGMGAQGLYQPKAAAQASPLQVEAVDGVRFRDIETGAVFRLFGVDACAPGQVAKLGKQPWPCGTMATAWLVKATLGAWVACVTLRDDGAERVARCSTASHPDLGAAMLDEGVAVLARADSEDTPISAYAAAEAHARKGFRGVWSSTFEMPWIWRVEHPAGARSAVDGEAK